MKIMISNDSALAHFYIRSGWYRALTFAGYDAVIWDINKKTAFDAFDEFEPDILITQTYNVNKAIVKCIQERPHLRVIMKASDWGTVSDSLDTVKYPILIANEKERAIIRDLREKTGKPDFIFVHYTAERMATTHNNWGIPTLSMLNGADILEFVNGEPKPEFACDIGFVGGRWGYKSQSIDRYLLPLCQPDQDYKIKIFGNQPWGISQYCGFLPDSQVRHFLASASICPNISEPHSQDLGFDIVERPFKLLSNKCFVVSDYVEDLAKLLPSIEFAKTPEDFKYKIDFWLDPKNNNTKQELINIGFKDVIASHTYFDRMHNMFVALNMPQDAEKIMLAKQTLIKELKL